MFRTDESDITDAERAPAFVPDRAWWETLFEAIDSGNAAAFLKFLTPDAQFRFANAPVVIGLQGIGAAVAAFFAAIASSRHRLLDIWSAGGSAGCEGEVTYTRHDGSVVTFPFANVFKLRGSEIASYRIYIDISSLFTISK
jgi:ketosteroid isomerase-like protein